MSIKLMTAVWESDLPYNLKHVALAYADSAHDDGTSCYPSIAYIAWKTGYQPRSVQAVTRLLESDQYRILIPQGRGPHGENNYTFNVAALPQRPQWQDYQWGAKSAPPPAKSAPLAPPEPRQGVQKTAPEGAKSAPDPKTDPKEQDYLDLKTTVPPPPPPAPETETDGGGGGGDGLTLEDAFELAGILNGVRGSIAKVWETQHHTPLQPLDVLAWHVYAQNNKVGPGAIVRRMQFGERPTKRLYAAAERYREQLVTLIRDLATWIDEDHAWSHPDRALADTYFDPTVPPGYRLIAIHKARQLHGPSLAIPT